ncbi:MAG: hypothetical protein BGO55_01535 [Sphingobacteriales bacterium 50-39]|nr:hypothetical protein [Sphingobacteriales bacterium]OJW53788.1 MAG: hypothetical protein BGO55_01535 [Sphingobacteriales bacterium 50-39]
MASTIIMKKLAFLIVSLLSGYFLQAQTKIFKEIGEDIATQIKAIAQDNTLVGYLAFTRLEKADADSFNYKLTIMDENLNDIGTVKFRQGILDLQSVSFEQNVLCLGYIQSSLTSVNTVRSPKDYKKVMDAAKSSHILLQFISLDGKILNSYYKDADLSTEALPARNPWSASMKLAAHLKYGMQIKNVPNSGFAFFYGDDLKRKLLVFDTRGALTNEQDAPTYADHFYLHTSASDIYLLTKQDRPTPEGGYKLYVYSAKDLVIKNNFDLRDRDDNWLKVLSFDNDPATGDAYIAGCIINPKRERHFITANDYSYIPYLGLFTLDLGNPNKKMHANCTYWSDANIPGIAEDGYFTQKGFYVRYATALRDFNGNTIFAGTALVGKGIVGAAKYKLADGVFIRQEGSGKLTLDNNIPCDETKYFNAGSILPELDKKDFYKVVNPDTKTNYMIIDDEENIYIYNVNNKKIARTIPHKDGNVRVNVYPAKEGHMMVSEYNRKEKYTRFSIEAL